MKNPAFSTWDSYVKMLKKPNEAMMSVLKTRYGDEALVNMIVVAKQNYHTEAVATKLEGVRLDTWLSNGQTADDIFKLLRLSKEGDDVFESAMWSTWVSYVIQLNKENPDESMFLVLKTHYGDKGLANLIVKAENSATTKTIAAKLQEEVWRSQAKTGDDVFNLLNLNKKGDSLFASPELSTWISYVTKRNKRNKKDPDEFIVVSELARRFGDDYVELARTLSNAKTKASMANAKNTVEATSELQALQFRQWMTEKGMYPKRVVTLLSSKVDDARNTGVLLNFSDFYKQNDGTPFY